MPDQGKQRSLGTVGARTALTDRELGVRDRVLHDLAALKSAEHGWVDMRGSAHLNGVPQFGCGFANGLGHEAGTIPARRRFLISCCRRSPCLPR
jgi:hypothetical protein